LRGVFCALFLAIRIIEDCTAVLVIDGLARASGMPYTRLGIPYTRASFLATRICEKEIFHSRHDRHGDDCDYQYGWTFSVPPEAHNQALAEPEIEKNVARYPT
jgi:hypothetical protein